MNDIYQNDKLKYPLSNNEFSKINDVWEFLSLFDESMDNLKMYRENIIKNVKERYSINNFYEYEKIANKLFWNLRNTVKLLLKNNSKVINYSYEDDDDLNNKIRQFKQSYHYYRSFINKLIIVNKDSKTVIFKPMEGSARIFEKNDFNLYTSYALLNRDLYEKIMGSSDTYVKINLPEFYYEYDYAFPNINFCQYYFGPKEKALKRIKKMYFSGNCDNWYIFEK